MIELKSADTLGDDPLRSPIDRSTAFFEADASVKRVVPTATR